MFSRFEQHFNIIVKDFVTEIKLWSVYILCCTMLSRHVLDLPRPLGHGGRFLTNKVKLMFGASFIYLLIFYFNFSFRFINFFIFIVSALRFYDIQ